MNAMEGQAAAHNDGTLFLDELSQVAERDANETAYMLANGQGKGRMTKGITVRKKLNWTLLFLVFWRTDIS